MVTYIYFVKCPNCEDEHFEFFDEAKDYALGCMSQKPIITQTEVCRNDFGECTDSADLGTVWSWEDMMKETDAEPTISVFTKDDLKRMADGKDPEFDSIDNSVDFEPATSEVSAIDEIPDNFRKPIPEGMTIEELVEEMEENEDDVECTWCNDLFDKSECRKEVDLGWLCSRCEMAIKSRGETLTFKENNYWDFLDEDFQELSFSEMVTDSINHLVNDLGKDSSAEDFADDVIADIEHNYDVEVSEDPEKYRDWASAVACEVSRQLNNLDNITEGFSWIKAGDRFTLATDNGDEHYIVRTTYDKEDEKHLDKYERFIQVAKETSDGTFENPIDIEYAVLADYKKRGKLMFESKSFLEDLEWHTYKITYSTKANPDKEQTTTFKTWQSDVEYAWRKSNANIPHTTVKNIELVEDIGEEPNVVHDLGNEYDGGYPADKSELPEVDETPGVSDSHLKLCPECGKETFDIETGICVDCGFN